MDEQLNISVVVNNIRTLDDAKAAVKTLNKELGATALDNTARQRELGAAIVATKNVVKDFSRVTQTEATKMMESYFKLGEQNRRMWQVMNMGGENAEQQLRRFYKEQRLGDRTMREATQSIGDFSNMLGGGGIGKVVGGAIGQFQSMEFAMTGLGIAGQSAGGKMASIGQTLVGITPYIAGAAAGFALLKMAMDASAELAERLNKAFDELRQTMIEAGKISKQEQIGALTRDINKVEQEKFTPSLTASALGMNAVMKEQIAFEVEKQTKIEKLLMQRAKLEKEITEEKTKQGKGVQETLDFETALNQEQERIRKEEEDYTKRQEDAAYRLYINGEKEYLAVLKKREAQAKLSGDLEKELALRKQIMEVEVELLRKTKPDESITAMPKLLSGGKGGGVGSLGAKKVEGVKVQKEAVSDTNKMTRAINLENEAVLSLYSSFDSLAGEISSGVGGALNEVFGGEANSLFEKMVSSFAQALIEMEVKALASDIFGMITGGGSKATSGILQLLGLASGGDITTGGSLQFAASGGNFSYGKTQNVLVGERGAELMQVGRNGVRVISNNALSQVNQMGLGKGYGASQVQKPSVQVVPIIDNQGLAVQVSIGQQQRSRRTM